MKEQWVKVTSEDELRVGMCFEIRTCRKCKRKERGIFMRFCNEHSDGPGWLACGNGCPPMKNHCTCYDLSDTISEGRLYRLVDEPPAVEEMRARELERVK